MFSETLRQVGYAVIEATNGDEALSILTAMVPDLIVTDIAMPGSPTGTQLLAKVRNTNPTMPVVVTSGHLENLVDQANERTHFLSKPYKIEALINIVQRELRDHP